MRTNMHPDVLAIARSFSVIGMATPGSAARKGNLLLQPSFGSEHIAVVLIDAVRCSTTILSALAAGAAEIGYALGLWLGVGQ